MPTAPSRASTLEPIPLFRWWRHSVVDTVNHLKVLDRIIEESGLSARFLFMTMMSAGIAVLGLLLSSPAVVIGAMLISPLMGPILGVGFALATFDFDELRRALTASAVGCVFAIAFTALIVLASPLQATTDEILARTRPNLFDLLVALFAALAGTFAIIRGRGETIVGVAIATALMPPLAVIGYGLATWNLPVLVGSLTLFGTNFFTIAFAATIMARLYGFGHRLSHRQTMLQTVVLLSAFLAMGVPLALALSQIAREALFVNQVRAELAASLGEGARISQLEVDFRRSPWEVRTVAIVPRSRAASVAALQARLSEQLARPLSLQLNQIYVDPTEGERGQRDALTLANTTAVGTVDSSSRVAELVALAAGVPLDDVTIDSQHRRAVVAAAALPDAGLSTYFALERRAAAAAEGWTISILPPVRDLPSIAFADGADSLDASGRAATVLSAWAAQRWNVPALAVPGLPTGPIGQDRLTISQRRAVAIAAVLENRGIGSLPAPAAGNTFRLSLPATAQR